MIVNEIVNRFWFVHFCLSLLSTFVCTHVGTVVYATVYSVGQSYGERRFVSEYNILLFCRQTRQSYNLANIGGLSFYAHSSASLLLNRLLSRLLPIFWRFSSFELFHWKVVSRACLLFPICLTVNAGAAIVLPASSALLFWPVQVGEHGTFIRL